jgi:hypothetical protein
MSHTLPEAQMQFGRRGAGRNQFEHRFLARGIGEFGQKNGFEFRADETLTQDEFPLDGLAFPFFPLFAHSAPHEK